MNKVFKTTMNHIFSNSEKGFISRMKDIITSSSYKNDMSKIINEDDESLGINTYTVFWKIKQITDAVEKGFKTILFIDELNRCEISVQEELLQLILDRKINTAVLPEKENCFIIAAGNPEQNDDNLDYNVNVMNPAFKDRMTKFSMGANVKDWLNWAQKNDINEKVVTFIADYPEMVHKVDRDSDVYPTPRSWEAVSDNINFMEKSGMEISSVVKQALISGDIGLSATGTLLAHFEDNSNPTLNEEDIFGIKGHKLPDALKERIESESHPRLIVSNNKCVKFLEEQLSENSIKGEMVSKYTEFVNHMPNDLLYAVMKELCDSNTELFMKLNEFKLKGEVSNYIDLYYDTNSKLSANIQ